MRVLLAVMVFAVMAQAATAAPTGTSKFKNCTALRKVYPHGVGKPNARDRTSSGPPVTSFRRSKALYLANRGLDRDGDGVACEQH